ncbi:SDR family NAD(P)-dependent oxidoreductase [Kamptonema animale CS-326]|jgi:acyl transferase domain-containing protein/acyl carrier protein|uniref:type I polyketide synthase n=1 Tax=Kamptonema animale TaxID=92934 RepID=UPI00232BD3E9|nr:type I polyketide synthase [Kamptonema animale]MDB9510451.1 SDR family NAD(P)-dependent oxidoreductase [Kamptonema animale CS-326]
MNNPIAVKQEMTEKTGLEIAIVGMAGRFPGAKNIEEFWQNLRKGIESISVFTDEEVLATGVNSAALKDPNYVKAAAILDGIEEFDADFFGFNPREAEITDPQHRIFLECAWEALESAGYNPENYQGAIGVYAGASMSSYYLTHLLNNRNLSAVNPYQMFLANDKDFLTTRVSYKLNLQGPSLNVQTACSTSLTAVHLACQSLLSGECDLALAGGVSIGLPQKAGYFYQEGGIFSPDGKCRAFDAAAQGTVSGRGAGIVVLKRLEEAMADGDTIYAVIKGSAINNDGSLKVSYTAPRIDGQAQVVKMAQTVAEVSPETISYIEAHGTGTSLGDPIEMAALTQVFSEQTDKKYFCAIGSLKTNIGHLDTASGVAGLIKTVLALQHQEIPPSLHFQEPNPQIDFENSPFYVNTALAKWERLSTPRRAGVSSFGIGGTNVHVVLEEAPNLEQGSRGDIEQGREYQLLVLSAKTRAALDSATANLAAYLKQHCDLNLADVAYTLQVGRKAFNYRRMLVCRDGEDAAIAISTPDRVFTQIQESSDRSVAFMFPGQGSQYANMGRELYQTEPIFQQQIDRCCELLKPHLGLDLRDVLYGEGTADLQQTAIAQPALFTIEYAIAQLWMAWGVYPAAAIGHSIGEYVAATLAGVFSLEEALELVAARGRLMQQLPAGAMLTVSLPATEVHRLLNGRLSLAAINGPSLCVVAGETDAIAQLQNQLTELGVSNRILHTSHAFHSQMVESILEPFSKLLAKIALKAPTIPFISNVTGTWISAIQATDANYWIRHLRQTVRFSEGIAQLLQKPEQILLEIGPGRTLSTFAKQQEISAKGVVLTSLRHPQDSQSDRAFLLNTLGRLWIAGVQINWSGFYRDQKRRRIPLPTYPFQRQRYWIEPQIESKPSAPLLGKKSNIAEWFYLPSWKRSPLLNQKQDRKFCWLVFADSYGLGASILKELEANGQDAIAVISGTEFALVKAGIYTINYQHYSDYNLLLKELEVLGKTPQKIIHLWGIKPAQDAENLGFWSLLHLAQAWGALYANKTLEIGIISERMHDLFGESALNPEQATVLGPCKVIPQEYPNIICRNIDIALPELETKMAAIVISQLIAELTNNSSDLVIAYRGNSRWVQTFEPALLEAGQADRMQLQKGGTYLITGGLGGIGLSIAKYLAQTVKAKLILVGRSPLPERKDWEQWLEKYGIEDAISCKIQAIQSLEKLGSEVLVKSTNVANLDRMQAVITEAREQFGEICGVIHAAGIPGGGMIQLKTPEAIARVLESKVKGTLVLDALFKDVKLDFFLLCSSLNAIVGGWGQVDYCAANAFLDAFASHKNGKNGSLVVSINWDTWQEVGMAVNTTLPAQLQKQREDNLKQGILPEEGVEALSRILQTSLSQVIVSTQDLQAVIKRTNSVRFLEEEFAQVSFSKVTHERPNLGTNYIAPRDSAEQTIAEIWQQLLGIQEVGISDNFFELGGHSLLATQVISQLRPAFQVELPLCTLFETPTVAGLALAVKQGHKPIENRIEPIERGYQAVEKLLAQLPELSEPEVDNLLNNLLAKVEVYR